MTAVSAHEVDVAVRSLRTELDTDWAPDPWGWADLTEDGPTAPTGRDLAESALVDAVDQITVAFVGGRRRDVPLLPLSARLSLHIDALRLLRQLDHQLPAGVRGYRLADDGTIAHYRDELRNRCRLESELARRYSLVAAGDVRSFFPSLTADRVGDVLSVRLEAEVPASLERLLKRLDTSFGYAVPEGYAPARALASLCLIPVDRALTWPFTRWIDDYRIFVHGESEADAAHTLLAAAVRDVGLEISERKRTSFPSDEVSVRSSSLDDHGAEAGDLVSEFDAALRQHEEDGSASSDRRLRFLVRLAAERSDPRVLSALASADAGRLPVSLMPRLAWLVSIFPDDRRARDLAVRLLEVDDDYTVWRAVRLGNAFWYLPGDSTRQALPRVRSLSQHAPSVAHAWLRPLARHDAEALRDVLEQCGISARETSLALAESKSVATGPLASVIEANPPVESYL